MGRENIAGGKKNVPQVLDEQSSVKWLATAQRGVVDAVDGRRASDCVMQADAHAGAGARTRWCEPTRDAAVEQAADDGRRARADKTDRLTSGASFPPRLLISWMIFGGR